MKIKVTRQLAVSPTNRWLVSGTIDTDTRKMNITRIEGDVTDAIDFATAIRALIKSAIRSNRDRIAMEDRKKEINSRRTARRLAKKHGIDITTQTFDGNVEVWVEIPDMFLNEYGEYDEGRFCASERHCYSWVDALEFIKRLIGEMKTENA